ncbi:hypothetical protein NKH77_08535 [Streptomyces sp. M19]
MTATLGDLVTREITWIGSYRFVEEIDDALRAMADGLDVAPVITTGSAWTRRNGPWPWPPTARRAAAR